MFFLSALIFLTFVDSLDFLDHMYTQHLVKLSEEDSCNVLPIIMLAIDPRRRRKRERMCLMGHVCSLLFSLPKDKADLNNDTLFLVARFTHSYTLIITNYQLVLNTLSGLATKILSINGLRNVKFCCSLLI